MSKKFEWCYKSSQGSTCCNFLSTEQCKLEEQPVHLIKQVRHTIHTRCEKCTRLDRNEPKLIGISEAPEYLLKERALELMNREEQA